MRGVLRNACVTAIGCLAVTASSGPGATTAARAGRIEFVRTSEGRVYIVNLDGTRLHRARPPGYQVWSRDARRVAFFGRSDLYDPAAGTPRYPRLVVANRDGTRRREIRHSPCFDADWAPDGSRLAFDEGCEADQSRMFVVNHNGAHLKRLAAGLWGGAPRWSPDGRDILFTGSPPPHNGWALYLTNAAARKPQRIRGASSTGPIGGVWSRDGKRIYVFRDEELWLGGRGGGRFRKLSAELKVGDFDLSPNGREIALQAAEDDRDWEIYLMRADGTDLRPITDNRFQDREPRWSLDGRLIAFTSERDGNVEIYVMSADGSNPRRITHSSGEEYSLNWIPAR